MPGSDFNSFIKNGVSECWAGVLDPETGYLAGSTPTPPAAGDQDGDGMVRMYGATSADLQVPAPDQLDVPGDNGSQGTFLERSASTGAFTFEQSVFDLRRHAMAQNTLVKARGGYNVGVLHPLTFDPADLTWIIQSPIKKKDQAVLGRKAWHGYEVPFSQAQPIGQASVQTRQVGGDRYRVVMSAAGQTCSGELIDATNFQTIGAPVLDFEGNAPGMYWRWTGDNTETVFNLPVTPYAYSADYIVVWVDGVLQVFTTAYAAAALQITFQAGHIPADESAIVAWLGYIPNAA